jgi:hypothetical protein
MKYQGTRFAAFVFLLHADDLQQICNERLIIRHKGYVMLRRPDTYGNMVYLDEPAILEEIKRVALQQRKRWYQYRARDKSSSTTLAAFPLLPPSRLLLQEASEIRLRRLITGM